MEEKRLTKWRQTMVDVNEIIVAEEEQKIIEKEERSPLGLSRGRARTKAIQSQPVVLLPDGKLEIQDIGTTLGDLLRYYPNYYLLENYHSKSPKPHRSASYLLREDGAYKLVKDDLAVDVKEEFSSLNEKIEELISENSQLQSQLQEVLSLAIQTRKDQLVVKQNFSSSNCFNCRESLKFKLSQRCQMCDQEFCSICVIRISFPVGFRKSKNNLFQSTKKCCVNCLSAVFYLRNNPPLDHLHTVNTVIIEKILNNAQNITPPVSSSKPLGAPKPQGRFPTIFRRRNDISPSTSNGNLSNSNIINNAGEFDGFSGSYFSNGTFYSSGNMNISLPLKFLDPLCRLTFWFGGVGEDLKFDRKTIDKATGTRYTASNKANKIVHVEVPEYWPNLLSNEECALGKTAPITCETVHNLELLVFMPSKMMGPWPVVIFFHGGGFCVGRPTDQIYENSCAKMATETGCVVVSVDYRLAPESKFPTQIEDSYAAIIWVYENHKSLNINREKIIVCGDSAGGSLAAVTAMMARDRNGPKITHQILVYPCISFPLDDSLESHIKYKDGPILSQKILRWFLTQLFPPGDDKDLRSHMNHIYASPILADLENLPPATIINAYHDPLRDQGEIYMEKLRAAGVNVTRTVYRKLTHGFYGAPIKESDECLMEICCAIRLAFGLDSLDLDYLTSIYLKHLKD